MYQAFILIFHSPMFIGSVQVKFQRYNAQSRVEYTRNVEKQSVNMQRLLNISAITSMKFNSRLFRDQWIGFFFLLKEKKESRKIYKEMFNQLFFACCIYLLFAFDSIFNSRKSPHLWIYLLSYHEKKAKT